MPEETEKKEVGSDVMVLNKESLAWRPHASWIKSIGKDPVDGEEIVFLSDGREVFLKNLRLATAKEKSLLF